MKSILPKAYVYPISRSWSARFRYVIVLLNKRSRVSTHTRETLLRLQRRGIAYTVATGRTLHAARDLLAGHGFDLPHIYKNGVVIWNPEHGRYSQSHLLTQGEIRHLLHAFIEQQLTPFLFTLEPGDVIATGTPHGVGAFRDPPVWLQSGDLVEVEIEGLGCLRNRCRIVS